MSTTQSKQPPCSGKCKSCLKAHDFVDVLLDRLESHVIKNNFPDLWPELSAVIRHSINVALLPELISIICEKPSTYRVNEAEGRPYFENDPIKTTDPDLHPVLASVVECALEISHKTRRKKAVRSKTINCLIEIGNFQKSLNFPAIIRAI